jgi:hypothetical protein
MLKKHFSRLLISVIVALSVFCQGTLVLAGTTGGLSISVVDPTTGQAISGAKVAAASPSQIASGVTDSTGHVNFLDLAPDTYTVSVEAKGYEPASLSGVNVVADNTRVLPFTPAKEQFREIGRVSARAASSLVKPGTVADVYSVNPIVQAKVVAAGGGGNLDSAWSALATVPGVVVQPGQSGYIGAGASVSIRGGDYDQIGYQIDGVPVNRAFDNYPSGPASSLGQQELQVYTGAPPASSTSEGISGYINQVIRTGTTTPFESVTIADGGPAFYHKMAVELGGETGNGRLSYYVGVGGYNQDSRVIDQFNGASIGTLYGAPYGVPCPAASATVTPATVPSCFNHGAPWATQLELPALYGSGAPASGAVLGGPQLFDTSSIADRDNDVNLHYYFPHKDGTRDDIQALYISNYIDTSVYSSPSDIGGAPYLDLIGLGTPFYIDGYQLKLPTGGFLPSNYQAYASNYYFPSTPTHNFDAPIYSDEEDGTLNNQGIEKLQFTKSLGSNAYARIYGYSYYSNWLQTGPNCSYFDGDCGVSADYELSAHTRGLSFDLADQINSQNLLQLGTDLTNSNVLRDNNTEMINGLYPATDVNLRTAVGVLVNSSSPTNGVCYSAPVSGVAMPAPCFSGNSSYNGNVCTNASGGVIPCFSGAAASSPVAQYATIGEAVGGTITPASGTCGTGACEYLVVGNGQYATYNQVKPTFTGLSLTDEFRPNSKLTINGGIRLDGYSYQGASTTGTAARTFFYNAYNSEMCISSTTHLVVDKPGDLSIPISDPCPAGYTAADFTNPTGNVTQSYNVVEPRLGFTYSVDPQTVIRAAYGRYAQPPNSAFEQYNTEQPDSPATLYGVYGFQQYGFTTPNHPIPPATSNNYDLSIEHQFPGQISVKLTPFIRKTQNQSENFFLNIATSFVSGLNVGNQTSRGFEFELDKGNFAQNGLAAKLSFTYTNSYIQYNSLSNGSTVLTPVVNAINTYNSYTKAGGGSPCYTTSGAAVTPGACTPADIANPYYNAPEQSLSAYTPTSTYTPYDTIPAGIGLASTQYGDPYVTSLVLNEKVNKLSITPIVQMFAGARYGDPLATEGINPATCTGLLSTVAPSSDPRYKYGSAGGSSYDATTCGLLTGGIPNTVTGNFDTIGQYVEPTQLLLHLQLSYDVSKNFTLTANFANILNTCFGGSNEPWNVKGSCTYTLPDGALGGGVGNTYNPGTGQIQPSGAYAYEPAWTQQPFGIFVSGNFKL